MFCRLISQKRPTIHLIIAVFFILFSINGFAETKKVTTSLFSISIPSELKPVWQNEDTNANLHQYVFRSLPNSDYSPKQIRVTVIGDAPKNEAEYPAWKLKALGTMVATMAEGYHLNLKNQSNVLNKKPDTIILGTQSFNAVTMTFDTMQIKFLVTIANNATYMFYLISINKDAIKRNANMNLLLDSIRTTKYTQA